MPSIKTRIKRMQSKEAASNRRAAVYISLAIVGAGFVSSLTKSNVAYEPPCPLYWVEAPARACMASEAYISSFRPVADTNVGSKKQEPLKTIFRSPYGRKETPRLYSKYAPYIYQSAKRHDIDPVLLEALIKQESAFNPNAVSKCGAIGLTQLMPNTAKYLGVNPYDPVENIEGGAMYLSQQLKRFKGNKRLALAAYNAGHGAVKKYKGIPPYTETKNYVASITADYKRRGGIV